MPQIFLDAISVTRELGIKYLWIDCLCILQDRPEDWERESAVMGKVYEHGICNLAATGASSGGKGLREQLNEATEPINFCKRKIECNWNSHDPQQSRIHYLIRGELWVLGVERAPLNGRCRKGFSLQGLSILGWIACSGNAVSSQRAAPL